MNLNKEYRCGLVRGSDSLSVSFGKCPECGKKR